MIVSRTTRRRFLKRSLQGAAAIAGASAVPMLIPSSALGLADVAPPSERIRLGLVGCGGHGVGWNLRQIYRWPDAQVLAVCDVDSQHLETGKKSVDKNSANVLGKDYKECAAYGDFRELIRRKDLDVVAVCTPDHWHVLPELMALKSGKDVIGEKPLTLFVEEGRVLADTVKKHGRVFQTASENRSIDVYFRLMELVRGGVIGRIKHIEVRTPQGNTNIRVTGAAKDAFGKNTVEDPPAELNYDMWLGQAPQMPYIAARVHGNFRWNLAFSGGVITDWGAHMIDLAQWGHNTEHTGPVTVEGKGDFPPRDAVYNTAATFEVHYTYADGVTMTVSAGPGDLDPEKSYDGPMVGRTPSPGIRFEGTDGWIECHKWRGTLKASKREMLDVEVDPDKIKLAHRPTEIVPRTGGGGGGEYRDFFDAVKSRGLTYAPAETGHRTITHAHIGNIAMLLGRRLHWNPEQEKFTEDAEANAMLTRKQREPWTMANVDKWL
jgi:predicted dehydrogenase